MTRNTVLFTTASTAFLLGACSDNPTALDDLDTDVQFDVEVQRVETFREIPIRITATESGAPMHMSNAQLEVRHGETGEIRVVTLERHEGEYEAHMYFYEEGDYHLRMMGVLEGHAIMGEFGGREIRVERQRQLIGSYWVEVEIAGGPVLKNSDREIRFLVYDLLPDSTRGGNVSSVTVTASVHAPDGDEAESQVSDEGDGEYALAQAFDHAGGYEVHVTIDSGGSTLEGEFYIPVHDPAEFDDETADDAEGDGGHGH